eukprot:9479862-Pyramimonas_sp.AAC.1
MADNKNSGLRRERVSWTLTNSQERKLLVLQNSLVQGQGSAIFEWAANSDSRMLNESQALDVPTLSAVIGLGQKKSAGKKAADGDGDDKGKPPTLLPLRRSTPDDSPFATWGTERKRGRHNVNPQCDTVVAPSAITIV